MHGTILDQLSVKAFQHYPQGLATKVPQSIPQDSLHSRRSYLALLGL